MAGRDRAVTAATLLFAALGPPVLWATHLSLSYFLLTLDCISAWDDGPWALVLATTVFALASGAAGVVAWRARRRLGARDLPVSERDWTSFTLALGVGASILFTATIILEGLAPLLTDLCA